MFIHNHTISIIRLLETSWKKNFDTTVINWLQVYFYPVSDESESVLWIDWSWNLYKLLSNYNNIVVWDKIVDENSKNYIVKSVKQRKTIMANFFEILILNQND